MVRRLCLIFVFGVLFFFAEGQTAGNAVGRKGSIKVLKPMVAKVDKNDTLYLQNLRPVTVFAWRKRPDRKTRRLIYNIKKAYPFARMAGLKLQEYEQLLLNAETDRARRKLMKQAEDELKEEYEADLKKLTYSQGRILLKLIDRQTGETSYRLVQDLRGKFSAFFWQSFARVFGFNLKKEYNPEDEDKKIEEIVQLIEAGVL